MTVRDTLMSAAGTGGKNYWEFAGDSSGSNASGQAVITDSSGNMYVPITGIDLYYSGLMKVNSEGTILWQVKLTNTPSISYFDLKVDSSNNVYVVGYCNISGAFQALIVKYNSSGVLQWQKIVGPYTNLPVSANSIDFDSSGNIYALGTVTVSPGYYAFYLLKIDTNGNLIWQKQYDDGNNNQGFSIKLDSSNNIYMLGYRGTYGSSVYKTILIKCDSSGSILWQKSLQSGYTDTPKTVKIDSTGYVYVAGTTNNGSIHTVFLAKYDNSGTLQWQRALTGSNPICNGMSIDSNDNIYLAGSGSNGALIVKYNTSGVLQWQRKLMQSIVNSIYFNSVTNNTNGDVVCVGTEYTGSKSIVSVLKVPSNGTRTGGHGNYIYTGSNFVDSAGSMTVGTVTFSGTTPSYTYTNFTGTPGTSSVTRTLTYF